MNRDYIQGLRYKLQKRFRRLNSADSSVFRPALTQFWKFMHDHPLCVGVLEGITTRLPEADAEAEKICDQNEGLLFGDEFTSIAVSYFVIRRCLSSPNDMTEVTVARNYTDDSNYNDILNTFRAVFVEPLYEYVDEQLDDQGAVLAFLRRYKQKCEWFQRDELFTLWSGNTRVGERRLARHLYEYLFDQGLDFYIEPSSASGEVDLIADQKGGDRLVADAKVFHNDTPKEYIAKGFNQVYRYLLDYNESSGYLIIYKTSDKDLSFAVSNNSPFMPFVIHNHKTIFFMVVDISPRGASASKAGRAKAVVISEEELISVVDDVQAEVASTIGANAEG
jgi:hypothetical protein